MQSPSTNNNPFLSNSNSSNSIPQSAVDLFAAEPIQQAPLKASDDLLQLYNPFITNSTPNNAWITNGTNSKYSLVFTYKVRQNN